MEHFYHVVKIALHAEELINMDVYSLFDEQA